MVLLMVSPAGSHGGADLFGGLGCAHLRVGHPCNNQKKKPKPYRVKGLGIRV